MSRQPTTVEEVFALMDRESIDRGIMFEACEPWANDKLAEAKAKYPFFGDHTYEEFLNYSTSLFDQLMAPAPQGPSKSLYLESSK